jgi:cytochrome b561
MLKNSEQSYGWLSKCLHWLVALAVFALFALGYWMVGLDYYSEWYKAAPHYHKSMGILLALTVLVRLIWRVSNPRVKPLANHQPWEVTLAHWVHGLLYVLLLVLFVSGYLISTADGRAIDVFNWFSVPSLGALIENQEDIAGWIHKWVAYSLMVLVGFHLVGALKHHWIDKDETLKRMM